MHRVGDPEIHLFTLNELTLFDQNFPLDIQFSCENKITGGEYIISEYIIR